MKQSKWRPRIHPIETLEITQCISILTYTRLNSLYSFGFRMLCRFYSFDPRRSLQLPIASRLDQQVQKLLHKFSPKLVSILLSSCNFDRFRFWFRRLWGYIENFVFFHRFISLAVLYFVFDIAFMFIVFNFIKIKAVLRLFT